MEAFKREDNFTMPDKPSEGLRVALNDLILCEQHPKYEINMGTWHLPKDKLNGTCQVCLGGAVLARVTDNPTLIREPVDMGLLYKKMVALDFFRRGCIVRGVNQYLPYDDYRQLEPIMGLGVESIDEYYESAWQNYSKNADTFKKNLFEIADKLEALGL